MLLNRGYLNKSRLRWLCSVLLLLHGTHQSIQADMFEGDDCEMKNMPGKCALGSTCTTFRDGIKQKIFTLADKVHCGFAVYEEIICCPNSIDSNTAPQVSERVTTEFWEDLIRTSTSTTTTTPRPLVFANMVLDASSPFFDFSKHLSEVNNAQKEQKINPPTPMGNPFFNQTPRRNANTLDPMENSLLNSMPRPNTNIPNTLENPFFNQNSRSRPNEMMFNGDERNGNYKLGAGGNPLWSIGGSQPCSNQNMGPGNGNGNGPRRKHFPQGNIPNGCNGHNKFESNGRWPNKEDTPLLNSPKYRNVMIDKILQMGAGDRPFPFLWSTGNRSDFTTTEDPLSEVNRKAINAGVNIVSAKLAQEQTWGRQIPQRLPVPSSDIMPSLRPFQFREPPVGEKSHDDGSRIPTNILVKDPSSTTVKTVSTRGNGERPAVAACRSIDEGLEVALTPHIIGGTVVDLGEYPHMAAIGYRQIGDSSGPYLFRCGGSLIAKRFVLTAAHCVAIRDPQASIVRMGVTNFTDPEQMRNVVEVPIRNVHIHPDYRASQVYNDIAILELETEVVYSNYIYPTCLYVNPEDLPTNSVVYVTGWGTVDIRTREGSNVLLKARLDMIGVDSCNESYSSAISRRQPFGVLRTQICAFAQNKDACQGDSGGPLNLVVDESTKKYRLVGVISVGFSCAIEIPGLYTRVASYLDYIESIVWPKAAKNPTEFAFS